jgi:hypothetical protein
MGARQVSLFAKQCDLRPEVSHKAVLHVGRNLPLSLISYNSKGTPVCIVRIAGMQRIAIAPNRQTDRPRMAQPQGGLDKFRAEFSVHPNWKYFYDFSEY